MCERKTWIKSGIFNHIYQNCNHHTRCRLITLMCFSSRKSAISLWNKITILEDPWMLLICLPAGRHGKPSTLNLFEGILSSITETNNNNCKLFDGIFAKRSNSPVFPLCLVYVPICTPSHLRKCNLYLDFGECRHYLATLKLKKVFNFFSCLSGPLFELEIHCQFWPFLVLNANTFSSLNWMNIWNM